MMYAVEPGHSPRYHCILARYVGQNDWIGSVRLLSVVGIDRLTGQCEHSCVVWSACASVRDSANSHTGRAGGVRRQGLAFILVATPHAHPSHLTVSLGNLIHLLARKLVWCVA